MTQAKTTRKSKATPKKRTPAAPAIDSLPINPFIYEILDLTAKQKTNPKKVQVLQHYADDSVKSLMIWNFDDTVISLLPEGEVPYGDLKDQNVYSGSLSENLSMEARGGEAATRQDLQGQGRTSLRREWQNLYNYVQGGNNSLSGIRREMMFINLLEGLHPREAELLVKVKDGKMEDLYNVSFDNVKDEYPDITWGNRS